MKHCYLMVAVVAAGMSQVQATELFVAPFGGYSFAASELDVLETETEDSGTLKVAESANYGVMLGFNTKDPGNVYFCIAAKIQTYVLAVILATKWLPISQWTIFMSVVRCFSPTVTLNPTSPRA